MNDTESQSGATTGPWSLDDVPAGGYKDFWLPMGESYTGIRLSIPVRVVRGTEPGPIVGLTAALHGDEINGTGRDPRIGRPGSIERPPRRHRHGAGPERGLV